MSSVHPICVYGESHDRHNTLSKCRKGDSGHINLISCENSSFPLVNETMSGKNLFLNVKVSNNRPITPPEKKISVFIKIVGY